MMGEKTLKGKNCRVIATILSVLFIVHLIQTIEVQIMPKVYASTPEDTNNWSMFGHDLGRQSHSLSSTPIGDNVKWVWNTTSEIVTSPAIADGYAIVACINGEIIAFNATTGAKLWTYYIHDGSTNLVWSSPAIDSGRVFIGARNNNFYCLNQSTGTLIWTFATGDTVNTSPLVKENRVYFGSKDGIFYCLDTVEGSLVWKYTFNPGSPLEESSPAVFEDIVVFGSFNSNVYALDASTGDEIWNYTAEGSITSSPAINGERVYLASSDQSFNLTMFCLKANTGSLIWNTTIETTRISAVYLSSPAVANGRVFIGALDGDVYSFNATTGEVLWKHPTADEMWSSPAVADGKVFIGSGDGKIYCLNEISGDLIWDKFTLGRVVSSPSIAGGTVFVGCGGIFEGGRIYAFGPDETLPSTLTLSLDATTTYLGFKVTMSGQLKGNGTGIDKAPILLSYSVNEGQNWNDITSALTSNGGVFSAEWIAVATGRFVIRASWQGDYPFLGHEAIMMLSVAPYEELYMFSVSSNSTLSELAFNSTSNELSFTATGENGTTGYVKVTIAKELVSNIADLNVYLDGTNLDYTVTSTASSWILNFMYTHSSHNIMINLGKLNGEKPTLNGGTPEILFVAIVVLAAVSISGLLIYYRHRKKMSQSARSALKATFQETNNLHISLRIDV